LKVLLGEDAQGLDLREQEKLSLHNHNSLGVPVKQRMVSHIELVAIDPGGGGYSLLSLYGL